MPRNAFTNWLCFRQVERFSATFPGAGDRVYDFHGDREVDDFKARSGALKREAVRTSPDTETAPPASRVLHLTYYAIAVSAMTIQPRSIHLSSGPGLRQAFALGGFASGSGAPLPALPGGAPPHASPGAQPHAPPGARERGVQIKWWAMGVIIIITYLLLVVFFETLITSYHLSLW